MRRAIELARRGEGRVEPNPQVGAVIVDEYLRPLAEGFHEFFGGPHAEINALAAAGNN
ncbi:MAG: riboflavin biosynthesis protein RibD, partial [Planctomycetaceae bacterium]